MDANVRPTIDAVIPGSDETLMAGGLPTQLHGAGVLRDGGRWYLYGEDKRRGNEFQGVACYSTGDWSDWRCEGLALEVQEPGSELDAGAIGQRPKVLRCPATGRYVMFLHADRLKDGRYAYARIGVATASQLTGPFGFHGTIRFDDMESRDIGAFMDEDGHGYLISEDRRNGTHIYRLRDDFLSIERDVICLRGADGRYGYESPAMVKRDGVYYWFGSRLTGWDLNDNMYATARDLAGPWSEWRLFAPEGSRTHDTQCSAVVPLDGDEFHSSRFLYIGDRWNPDDLGASETVLMPIEIGGGKAWLRPAG